MCDRMRIALASCLIWMMLCAEKAQTNCPRTNRRASRMCARSCSPETGCGNPTDECLCDGDCGYSCVGKGLSCGKPPSVRKAQPQYQSTNFGAVVTYVCNTGYTLSGASQRTCRGIGKWDDVGPKCLAMCSTPVIPFSTYIAKPLNHSGSYSTGETITLACKKGFKERPGGNPIRICISGRWIQFPFKCMGTHSCRRTIRPARTKCTQECSPESGCGSDRYSCLCDGRCGYSCIEKGMSCGKPLTIANGKLNFTGTGYNDTAHYTCHKGYSLNTDSPVKRCTAKKRWDGLPARCMQDCVKPEVPRNAIISNPSESYRSGDKVTFKCKEGFNQEGIATQMCFQGGWTVLPFKCSGDCESELGMKNKQISDDSITASSHYQNDFPHLARVDSNSGAWCSDPTDVAPYIQIDLKEEKIITGVDTQGSFRPMRWVDKFKIKYLVQNNWTTYGDSEGSDKVFEGSVGIYLIKINVLQPPLRTQKIRIYPYQSQGDPSLNNVACLRLELKGCALPASTGNVPGYSGSGEGWDLYSGLEKDTDQSAAGAGDE